MQKNKIDRKQIDAQRDRGIKRELTSAVLSNTYGNLHTKKHNTETVINHPIQTNQTKCIKITLVSGSMILYLTPTSTLFFGCLFY